MVKDLTWEKLEKIWTQQIQPLLEEYFLSDVNEIEKFKFDDIWK
jgi:hypothetical protein